MVADCLLFRLLELFFVTASAVGATSFTASVVGAVGVGDDGGLLLFFPRLCDPDGFFKKEGCLSP